MKFPDPLRALCREIVARHLPAEREVFDLVGDDVLDQARDPNVRERGIGEAEFGRGAGEDLEIVIVADTMAELAEAAIAGRRDPARDDVASRWRKLMTGRGLDAAVAGAIASGHADALVAYIVAERAARAGR